MTRCILAALVIMTAAATLQPQTATKSTAQVFRLGGPDADDPYAFAQTPRLVVDSAGNIFARVPGEPGVLVLAPDGKHVRTIGRRGQGPGEFEVVVGVGLIGDTLWITGAPIPRVSLFRKSGEHVRTEPSRFSGYAHRFSSPQGIAALLVGGRALVLPGTPIGLNERATMPALVGRRDMRATDTIALLPRPAHLFIPGIGTWWWAPVTVGPMIAISPNGSSIAVADWSDAVPGAAEIRLHAADGTVQWRRRLQLSSPLIPRRVRDSLIGVGVAKVRAQVESARRQGKAPAGSLEGMVERGLSLPRTYPPICGLVVGVDGTVWIEQTSGLTGGMWLVLDRSGNKVFDIRVPTGFALQQATLNSLWGTTVDDLGVSYLVRLRIVG